MWGTIVPAATTTLRRTVLTFIRFDMRAPASGPASAAELHTATLDMAEWADRLGFDSIVVSEHHGAEDGFLPSPIVAAAAIAGRTKRAGISISALLAPLHDPIRIAEDLAVLDLLSEGRVTTILGLGYRPEEFAVFNVPLKQRDPDDPLSWMDWFYTDFRRAVAFPVSIIWLGTAGTPKRLLFSASLKRPVALVPESTLYVHYRGRLWQ